MHPIQSIVEKLIELLNLQYAYITFFGKQIVLATVRWVLLILMTKQGQSERENGDVQSVITMELHYFKTSPPVRGSRPTTSELEVRNIMKSYVNSVEGSVPWQWDHVRSKGDKLPNKNS